MINNPTQTGICILKGGNLHYRNCWNCLRNDEWRKSIGIPDFCPHGVKLEDIPQHLQNITVVKAEDWPAILKALKLAAKSGDKGLGDIVARIIGPIGGDAYKKWFEKIFGRPCGCSERQDYLNQRYPL